MKKLGFYAAVVAALVFTLWFCTKDGMQPSEGAAPAEGSVKCVMLESLSMGRRVSVEDPEDIERLSGTLSTLSEENGVVVDLPEDFPESMRDWTIEWLSQEGERLALVEISSVGTVFRGDQCFNFLGGEIFDMDYLRGLLLGLPEAREPQRLIDAEAVGRANLSGNGGDTVVISGEAADELKDILRVMSFYQGEKLENGGGCGGYGLELFDTEERSLGTLRLWGDRVGYGEYIYGTEGGGFDTQWINRMFDTMPEADYGERYPIVDFKYDEDLLEFSIGTAADGSVVRITDPELMERLEEPVREMEFKACGPYDGGEPAYWINRYFADNYYSFAIKIVDKESIEYGGWLYKLMDGKKFDLDLYAQLLDPSGPYKDHPGVLYWKEGDPPMPAVTPRPSPSPSGEPEPTPAGTAGPYIMDDPPEEKVFDVDGGHMIMTKNNGGRDVVIKGGELENLAKELSGLRFELREQCSRDSDAMHAQKDDIALYHGNPLYTLIWFDKDGYKREEFTARGMKGWIDCNGWYYQAKEGGIDMENLKRLSEKLPRPDWYEWKPRCTLQDISEAGSLWISDEDESWTAVVTDTELLERISDNLKDKEFFAEKNADKEGYAYRLEWYEGVLGPLGRSTRLDTLLVGDKYSINSGGSCCYKLREGEIDMELLDELAKPDGKYSGREGVRFVRREDLRPKDNTE